MGSPVPPPRPELPKRRQGAHGGIWPLGRTQEWSRIFGRNLSRPQVSLGPMKYLRALLLVIGIAGAILTIPAPSLLFTAGGLVFGLIFLAFLGLTLFAWRLGRAEESQRA